jgi:tetratricopeptide (TPR) repeat protein
MYHSRLILGFILIWSWALTAEAQQKSLSQVDEETYKLYQQGNWDALIVEGKEALKNQIDYYYLRVRLGIAYYEKENFHQASIHFEKALQLNDDEEYVKEYLYYSYLLAGRSAEAKVVSATFSPFLKQKTQTESRKFIEKLDLAYNYTAQADQQIVDEFSPPADSELEGSQFVPNQHNYVFLGIQHDIAPRFSFYHGYSGMQASHLLYTQSEGESYLDPDYLSTLHQYYAAGNFLLSKGLSLVGGIHFIHVRYPVLVENQVGQGQNTTTEEVIQTDNDMVYFGSLYRRWSYITLGGSFYYGTIANAIQNQADLKLILYPKGNSNLYTISVLSWQKQETGNLPTTNRILFEQQIGTKISNKLWLEAYGTFGEMENFILNDGVVIFNRLDKITQRIGGRVILFISPKWSITFDYTHFSNQSEFKSGAENTEPINQKEYNLQSLTGILSWRF